MNQNLRSSVVCRRAIVLVAVGLVLSPAPVRAAELPDGFVRLADVAPGIRQDILYAGSNNFLGRPANGYDGPACILTRQAAHALAQVQERLEATGKSLVVFDCYRPLRAVADFVAWVKQGGPVDKKWSPKTPRKDLIRSGYIGLRSAHARGSTVDLAIVDKSAGAPAFKPACGHAVDAMLDFGSGVDCFDRISNVGHASVPSPAASNRRLLIDLMAEAGFRSYAGEWWHFTLRREPFRRGFDFPVE